MTLHLPVVTHSELKTFRRCQREWQLSYLELYRPRHAGAALSLGSLVHRELEAWWSIAGRFAPAPDGEFDYADLDPYDVAKGLAMLHGYHLRYVDQAVEVLAVEKEFRLPLVNPKTGCASKTYQLGGKLDALARVDGKVFLVEHKTTSEDPSPGSDYARRLRIDGQISLYYAAVRSLGYEPAGVLYDVLKKPGLRPLKAGKTRKEDETPEEYGMRCQASLTWDSYQRFEVTRLEAEEESAALDVWLTTQQMRVADLHHSYPRNPDACVRYGQTCAFFPVCTGEADLETSGRYRRATRRHEELAPDGAEEKAA